MPKYINFIRKIFLLSLLAGGLLSPVLIFSPGQSFAQTLGDLPAIEDPELSPELRELINRTAPGLQGKAIEFCKNENTNDEKPACRNGYRHGYMGDESRAKACENREPFYNQKEETACKKGYREGVKQKTEDGAAASTGGRLGSDGEYTCGTYNDQGRNVRTKFDFGCLGTANKANPGSFPNSSKNLSPILDFGYAIIRFLSIGVGIAITIALIASGIQYSASEGSAEASTKAKKRIESALTGLVIFIFTWSLMQFLIPGGVFK